MNHQPKLLIAEDDPNLGQILKEYLEVKGYQTILCKDGEEGLEAFQNNNFSLCILDIMMPKKDGFTLAKEIRSVDKKTPIIFLTAKSLKEDTIEGFKIGGDDYITKPFSMEELLLRMKAILKRTGQDGDNSENQIIQVGKFSFDPQQQVLTSSKKTIKLTSKENDLLKLLSLNKNQTLERSIALKMIWKDDSYFNARSMDVYIAKLRKLLKEDPNIQILTIHGQGFKLIDIPY